MTKYIALAFSAVLVGVDQLLKAHMVEILPQNGRIEVVRGLFYLTYVENRGAAFGILQNLTGLLSLITAVVLMAALYYLLSGKVKSKFMIWSLSLVIAGGVGNLIDRVYRGYVVDYLDFSALFGFPVFNFADCCVVVGTVLILCGIVWSDRRATDGDAPTPEKNA